MQSSQSNMVDFLTPEVTQIWAEFRKMDETTIDIFLRLCNLFEVFLIQAIEFVEILGFAAKNPDRQSEAEQKLGYQSSVVGPKLLQLIEKYKSEGFLNIPDLTHLRKKVAEGKKRVDEIVDRFDSDRKLICNLDKATYFLFDVELTRTQEHNDFIKTLKKKLLDKFRALCTERIRLAKNFSQIRESGTALTTIENIRKSLVTAIIDDPKEIKKRIEIMKENKKRLNDDIYHSPLKMRYSEKHV